MPVRLLECFFWQKRLRLLGFPSSVGLVGDLGLLEPEEPEAVSVSRESLPRRELCCAHMAWGWGDSG